jgi:hypothetical protein
MAAHRAEREPRERLEINDAASGWLGQSPTRRKGVSKTESIDPSGIVGYPARPEFKGHFEPPCGTDAADS